MPSSSPAGTLRLVAATLSLFVPAAPATPQEICAECHADPEFFEGMENAAAMVVTEEIVAGSIHGEMGFACVDCHMDVSADDVPHAEELEPVDCSFCHDGVVEEFGSSVHGYAVERGQPEAPSCVDCHGSHEILPAADPGSPTHRTRVAELCSDCHGSGLRTAQFVRLPTTEGFAQSVHGAAMSQGNEAAATCTDCHGVHSIRGTTDPRSQINRLHVAQTCGTCHDEVEAAFDASIHGLAVQAGVTDSPTCNDCHGEHLILSPADPDARTHAASLAMQTCADCHDDDALAAKYGLAAGVVGSYSDSYHGWASRLDSERAATCVSCHTTHHILPAVAPRSSVHPDNVVATCQQCHPRADTAFAASYTHTALSVENNPINRFLRNLYLVLIAVVIGGMVVHNAVVIGYYMGEQKRRHREEATLRRLDRWQIIQHALLAGSFILLVITGFALRFPDAWWVEGLAALGMTEAVRGDLHRVCGALLIVLSVAHLGYILFHRRGRYELRRALPGVRDLREMVQYLAFHLRLRDERPRFGRYDYTQKAEYWAVVWGTALMAFTGLVLWLPAYAVEIFPSWIVTASQTVHYYEAWLATLAIVFWHFFFVIFHPEHYPMSWTWLTGRMPESEARHHHPEWYREAVEARVAEGTPAEGTGKTGGEEEPEGEEGPADDATRSRDETP